MSSSNSRIRKNKIVIPTDIGDRKLPALPISKRKLPSLTQSPISDFQYNYVGCSPPPSPMRSRAVSMFQRDRASKARTPTPKSSKSTHFKKLFSSTTKLNPRRISQKWFNSKTLKSKSVSTTKLTATETKTETTPILKSKWRPSLQFIYDDPPLLTSLITFMTKQYNEENIFFLLCVLNLNNKIDALLDSNTNNNMKEKQINFDILSIYNQYIIHNAVKQVNLSYDCFMNAMYNKDRFMDFNLALKKSIFNFCVSEIEKLVITSILSGFYASDEFNIIAATRKVPVPPPPIVTDYESFMSNASNSNTTVTTLNTGYSNYDEYEITAPSPDCGDYDCATPVVFNFDTYYQLNKESKYVVSAKGYIDGYHEWGIKILSTNEYRQEIGVVSNADNDIKMSVFGICGTPKFGARVVYGCNKRCNNSFYYASYNSDNKERCNKDLSLLNVHQHGWKNGDVIKVRLDLNKGNIKFYLNDTKIRRTLSVEKNVRYYPIIHFIGNCGYKIL